MVKVVTFEYSTERVFVYFDYEARLTSSGFAKCRRHLGEAIEGSEAANAVLVAFAYCSSSHIQSRKKSTFFTTAPSSTLW